MYRIALIATASLLGLSVESRAAPSGSSQATYGASAIAVKAVPSSNAQGLIDPAIDSRTLSVSPGGVSLHGQLKSVIASGAYARTPNYVGQIGDTAVLGLSGSMALPSTTQGAAGLFQKYSKAIAFNSLAGIAYKTSSAPRARATGVYGEAADIAGGYQSFVEGGRFQGTLISGSQGAAYGVICSAGNDPHTGVRNSLLLIGCEGEVDDQIGPDAPTFAGFSRDRFKTSFLASQGVGAGLRYKADAAFAVNPYSLGKFQTGLLLTSAVADTGIAASRGTSIQKGIDFSLSSISYGVLIAPNNAPIRFSNAAKTGDLNVLNVTSSNDLQVGADVPGRAILAPPLYMAKGFAQLAATTFAALPGCDHAAAGTIAYIKDASAAISGWHQRVIAGGGTNSAFITCNGAGWFAYAY